MKPMLHPTRADSGQSQGLKPPHKENWARAGKSQRSIREYRSSSTNRRFGNDLTNILPNNSSRAAKIQIAFSSGGGNHATLNTGAQVSADTPHHVQRIAYSTKHYQSLSFDRKKADTAGGSNSSAGRHSISGAEPILTLKTSKRSSRERLPEIGKAQKLEMFETRWERQVIKELAKVDQRTLRDCQQVSIYCTDISKHMIEMEQTQLSVYGYMQRQDDLNQNMRAILVDWLTEVHFKFKLSPETLFLTVNLLDRFL